MSREGRTRRELLTQTREDGSTATEAAVVNVPWLTILHHPVCSRAGEEAMLGALEDGHTVALSRTEPDFARGGHEPWPLADPFITRQPIHLSRVAEGVEISIPASTGLEVRVEGEPVVGKRVVPNDRLDVGVVLALGGRVVLLLHRRPPHGTRVGGFGLVGESAAIEDVREQVARVADLDVPVLVRGETGTGKELVARAIHEASDRRDGPFRAVNMAALGPQLAAAELFGYVKGAFTGATSDQPGYIASANGGTFFLDEIGDASMEVQAMLLRTLETSTVQSVGDPRERRVDVRFIAATDADLTEAVDERRFRAPLLHRLRGYEIRVPPLRERRDDVGMLVMHFLREILTELGEVDRLEALEAEKSPWFPAEVALPFHAFEWPGNVRELRNAVRQLAISSRGASRLTLDRDLRRLFDSPPPPAPERQKQRSVRPSDIGEDELIAALAANRWRVRATAKTLGLSPSSVAMMIDRSDRIRKASDISKDEILAARRIVGDELDPLAAHLEVSARGLKARLKALGL